MSTEIAAEYGQSADGPMIFVELVSLAGGQRLRSLLEAMGASSPPIALGSQPGLRLVGDLAIDLVVDLEPGPHMRRIGPGPRFRWSGSPQYWRELVPSSGLEHLLAGLGGHVYLVDDPEDDAILEVSYGEALRRRPSEV